MDESLLNMHERLVNHLDGISGEEERKAVAQLIASDREWNKAWEDLNETKAAILHFGLKEKIVGIHEEMKTERQSANKTVYRRLVRPFLGVAAALILLVGGYYFYRIYSISSEKVFESNYVSYDLGTLRGANDQPSELEQAFRRKDHASVLRIYSKLDTATNKEKFLAGIASLETRDYRSAKTFFKNIIEDKQGSGLYKDESEYYLSLSFIASKEYDQALPLLKKIRDEKQHPYHQEVDDKLIQDVKLLKWK